MRRRRRRRHNAREGARGAAKMKSANSRFQPLGLLLLLLQNERNEKGVYTVGSVRLCPDPGRPEEKKPKRRRRREQRLRDNIDGERRGGGGG